MGVALRGDEWSAPLDPDNRSILNALHGLVQVFGAINVILLVDDPEKCVTVPGFLNQSLCADISHCQHPEHGVPTMDCIFSMLIKVSTSDILGYINADILVF